MDVAYGAVQSDSGARDGDWLLCACACGVGLRLVLSCHRHPLAACASGLDQPQSGAVIGVDDREFDRCASQPHRYSLSLYSLSPCVVIELDTS